MEEVFVNNGSHSFPLFGGNQTWSQREESFKLNSTMKVKFEFSNVQSILCLLTTKLEFTFLEHQMLVADNGFY